ncbi:transposase [Cytobacillus sp. NJ13]|nr:transposase [Cytobacillus sp. NJ13]
MICDLQTHKPLALLPDRRPETVTAWLEMNPFVQMVSRDGFTAFRQGITEADPSIKQIYDRFHFIRNAKKQLDTWASPILPAKITWIDSSDIDEEIPLTRAERQTSDRQKRKWGIIQEIQEHSN